jgi:anaerobic glycerol-3-phosphate dehydrogenase
MSKYDIIIIGSGLGGLECGAILSKEMRNSADASRLTNEKGICWIRVFIM